MQRDFLSQKPQNIPISLFIIITKLLNNYWNLPTALFYGEYLAETLTGKEIQQQRDLCIEQYFQTKRVC